MWTSVYYQKPLDGPKVVSNIFKWSVEITKGESGKSTCGPAFLVGLAVVPLLLRRRK
ncbi:CGP-CTERM sorting domain-containing protein [Thermococcus sp. JCM 11816]